MFGFRGSLEVGSVIERECEVLDTTITLREGVNQCEDTFTKFSFTKFSYFTQ
jgi:hypothetical protein